jgi:ParB family chromosome partitioning protein
MFLFKYITVAIQGQLKYNNIMKDNLKHANVFWIEVDKIKPNPMQPRAGFNEERLRDLAESIIQYGVLQPLIVTRKEIEIPDGRIVEYELIAGERRLRAAEIAGLFQVPVLIREQTEDKIKLELAIIENLQREDLNPLERANAFSQLIENFNLKHHEVGRRIGKSRVFVTNTLRLLHLPEEIQKGLTEGIITEGHMRPLLMLSDKKEEQMNLYREILNKKMTVREAESISRRIAYERARRKDNLPDPEIRLLEERLSESLGTKVQIECCGEKKKMQIEFFSNEELQTFLDRVLEKEERLDKEANFPLESQQPEDNEHLIEKFTI